MDSINEIAVVISKLLFDQAEILARNLDMAPKRLVELALEVFIKRHSEAVSPSQKPSQHVNQGDVYWVNLDNEMGMADSILHPHVVVQDNLFNHSRLTTVVICALTTNVKRASLPGNLVITAGEANLPKTSVVEVSKLSTVEKSKLGDYIGTLSDERVHQILAGMAFLQRSYFSD